MKNISTLILALLAPSFLFGATTNFGNISIANVPIGTILPYAGQTLPSDGAWMWADGSCLQQSAYASAYAILGTLHGNCDNVTGYFNLPDMRGRFMRGWAPADINSALTNAATVAGKIPLQTNNFRTGQKVKIFSATNLANATVGTVYYARRVNGTPAGTNSNQIYLCATRNAALNSNASACLTTVTADQMTIQQMEDPDVGTRLANTFGSSTGLQQLPGNYQDDDFRGHTHLTTIGTDNNQFGTPAVSVVYNASGTKVISATPGFTSYPAPSQSAGGNESRPNNIAMGYIIRVK